MPDPTPKPLPEWAVCIDKGFGYVPIWWRDCFGDACDLAKSIKLADPSKRTCVSSRLDGAELLEQEAAINQLNHEIRELQAAIIEKDRKIVHAIVEALLIAAQRGWQLQVRHRKDGRLRLAIVGHWSEVVDERCSDEADS